MRRSSASERASYLGPLRPRNDGTAGPSSSARKPTSTRYSNFGRKSNNSTRMSNTPAATPCKSFIPTAASASRNSRGSIAFGRPSISRDVKKDTRPLSDKSYQNKCIKKLVDFLVERNYPYSINSKHLVSPMNKDFAHIFEFLYKFIDPQFALPQKFEEEVLRALKLILYPYTISKSAMYTVGSRHSWPLLLGALNWLREFVENLELTEKNGEELMFPSENFDMDDDPSEKKMLYEFYKLFYPDYLKGQNSVDDQEDFLREIAQKDVIRDLPCHPDDDLELELQRLEEESNMLETQENPLKLLKDKEEAYKSDHIKFDEYLVNLKNLVTKRNTEMEKISHEVDHLKTMVITAQEKRVEEKEKFVKAQNISQHDIDRMRMEKEELHRQIMKHVKEIEEYEKQINEKQMEAAQLNSQMDTDCNKFNEIYMATATVQNSSNSTCYNKMGQSKQVDQELSLPADFQLKVTFSQNHYLEWINSIKPKLQKTKLAFSERVEQLRDQLVDKEEIKQKLMDFENEQKEEIECLNQEIVALDQQMSKQKDKFNLEFQRVQNEESGLKSMIRELSTRDSNDVQLMNLEKKINNAEQELCETENEKSRYEVELSEFLQKCFLSVKDNFRQLDEMKKHFEDHCEAEVKKAIEKQPQGCPVESLAKELGVSLDMNS